MKKFKLLMVALFAVGAALAAVQVTSLVQGGKINRDAYPECQEQRIDFRCPGCDGEFRNSLRTGTTPGLSSATK